MKRLKAHLNPESWGLSFYAGTFLFLLALNLFSPKGIIHWILMKQESHRLDDKITATQKELDLLKDKQNRFSHSDTAKLRAIREELGLLKNDEISIEFTGSKMDSKK